MDRPWLDHYDAGVPRTLHPYDERTLLDDLEDAVRADANAPALYFKGTWLSYGALDRLSDAFAAALRSLGLAPGERLALLLPNCPQFLIAEFGAWKAGLIVVPLNPVYSEAELAPPLRSTGCRAIVVLTPFYRRVKSVQSQTPLRTVIATNIKQHLPPLLRLLFTLLKEKRDGHRVALDAGDLEWSSLLERHQGAAASAVGAARAARTASTTGAASAAARGPGEAREPEPARESAPARASEPALILLSGGTTGTPKGVVGTHGGLTVTGRQLRAWFGEGTPGARERILLPLPLFHSFGAVGAQSFAFACRYPLALVPNPRDIGDIVKTIEKTRPTLFAGVPTLYAAILNHPRVRSGKVDFRSMRACLSGAAPLLAETQRRFEALTGGRILEAYSLTEAMLAVAANPMRGVRKPGSVGMPVTDVEMGIMDPDSERWLEPGEVGEILIRAPQVMPGYWENPEESRHALREHGEAGPWLHTGDLGYLDEDGYLFIVDRLKDLMKPGGLQVWPREVEEVVAAHPDVAETGVAGVQDKERGEIVKAWVVARPGASPTADDIRAFCKTRLAPFKVPSQVEFRESLPKSMIGKVLRRKLVEEHRAAQS